MKVALQISGVGLPIRTHAEQLQKIARINFKCIDSPWNKQRVGRIIPFLAATTQSNVAFELRSTCYEA